jgi:hypothetical protein
MKLISQKRSGRRATRNSRGAALGLIVISLVMIFAMAALVVDLGYMKVVRGELQSATDAAALACVQALDMDPDAARYVAEKFAALNEAGGSPVVLDRENDIVFGIFDEITNTFVPLDAANEGYADAVQITTRITDVPFYFAPVIGFDAFDLSATATARYKPTDTKNIVGLKKVEFKNDTYTDAYNSSFGAYSAETAISHGSISSNKEIKLANDVIANGDVYLPPDGKLDVGGNATLNGTRMDLPEALNHPDVPFSNIATDNDNASISLTQNGINPYDGKKLEVKKYDTLDLPPGNYYFEELKLEENAALNISDLTTFFITKKIDAENGAINNMTMIPSNLQINSLLEDPLDSLKLPKNYDLYASIYAPSAKIEKKGASHFFGLIITNELTFEGGAFHADLALFRAERGRGAVAILVK